jgi:hypothetical protein
MRVPSLFLTALLALASLASAADTQPATTSASAPAESKWTDLYANEDWYKSHPEKEQTFTGTLQRVSEAAVGISMRAHVYKLGNRLLYPGKKHDALEKLVGKPVEIKGKPYDENLEGQALSEIWPAAVRPKPAETKP